MPNFLIKLFIKDYNEINAPSVRRKYGLLGSIIGIIVNCFLFLGKLILGIFTGSIAITSDAMNNLSDASSSVITLVGFKMSGKPADSKHPYGHGRIEYISGLFVSIAIIIVGFELAITSLKKLFNPTDISFSSMTVIILSLSIIAKLWLGFTSRKIGQKIDSASLKAASQDSLNDSVATFMVLLGMLLYHFTGINADSYIGLGVAIFILISGCLSTIEVLDHLVGKSPNKNFVKAVSDIVLSHNGIIGVHDLLVHNYGPNQSIVSLHAEVPNNLRLDEIHDIIDHIECELKDKFNCIAVIHMDPVAIGDENYEYLYGEVKRILRDISEKITFHDLRIVTKTNRSHLAFDIVVPFNFSMSDNQIVSIIKDRIYEITPVYSVDITVDKGDFSGH